MSKISHNKSIIQGVAFAAILAILSGCGGGGGSSPSPSTRPTPQPDTTPADFSFDAVPDAVPGETYTSNAVTIEDIDEPVTVSVSANGLYAVDGGDFINTPSEIEAGQTLTVRTTASDTLATPVNVELTVGPVTEVFTVTTVADTTPPTAEIHFPTPKTLTEASTVFVRGVASDDLSEVVGVTVNGTAATSTDGFATWQVESVPLTPGEETALEIVVTDAAGNVSEPEVMATVTQTSDLEGTSFPDASVPFARLADIEEGPGELLYVANRDGLVGGLYSLDPRIAELAQIPQSVEEQIFGPIVNIVFDNFDQLYILEVFEGAPVTALNLISGVRAPISDDSYEDTSIATELIAGADLFDGGSTIPASLVVAGKSLFRVDITTGIRSQLTDLDEFSLGGVAVDDTDGSVYVYGSSSATAIGLYLVNIATGERELIATNDQPNSDVPFGDIRRISLINNGQAAIALADLPDGHQIIRIDLEDGENKGKKTRLATFNNDIHDYCLSVDEERQLAYVCTDQRSISVVDLVGGSYHVVAKSAEPQLQ